MKRLKLLLAALLAAGALNIGSGVELSAGPPYSCGGPNWDFVWCPGCQEAGGGRFYNESWTCTNTSEGFAWVWNWSGSYADETACINASSEYCPENEGGGGEN